MNPNMEEKDTFKLEFIIEVDKLVSNSIILFRVAEYSPVVAETIEALHQLYDKQFKEKNISFLVLKSGTEVSTLRPEEMIKLGWEKKEKSLIIH